MASNLLVGHTAYEDGQRCSGQWNDEWRAGKQSIDHSSNALANNGLLNICQKNRWQNVLYALRLNNECYYRMSQANKSRRPHLSLLLCFHRSMSQRQ